MTAELFLEKVGTIYDGFFDRNFYQPIRFCFCFFCFGFFLILTLKFDLKGAFDRSYSEIRLDLKFLFQLSTNVIF